MITSLDFEKANIDMMYWQKWVEEKIEALKISIKHLEDNLK